MKNPKFEKIIPLLEAGESFSLTESQYLQKTGVPLPKNIYYLKCNSALSKTAKAYGYCITVTERTICLKKAN